MFIQVLAGIMFAFILFSLAAKSFSFGFVGVGVYIIFCLFSLVASHVESRMFQ